MRCHQVTKTNNLSKTKILIVSVGSRTTKIWIKLNNFFTISWSFLQTIIGLQDHIGIQNLILNASVKIQKI